jgi:hypothetical protein
LLDQQNVFTEMVPNDIHGFLTVTMRKFVL